MSAIQQILLSSAGVAILPPTNTLALLHMDGGNGASIFTDETGFQTWSATGATTSTTQEKFGPSSMSVGPDNNYITSSGVINCGSGDFTIEGWVYHTGSSDWQLMTASDGGAPSLVYNSAANTIRYAADGSNFITIPATPSANAWHHIAIVLHSAVPAIYIDGVAGTPSITGTVTTFDSAMRIGNSGIGKQAGFIDEVRVSKIARYTGNFTPSVSAFTVD